MTAPMTTSADDIEWPREIWMAEREEYDQGRVSAVLSEFATVARWEGDRERDREFHRYVDADIYESADAYWRGRCEALAAERDAAIVRAEAAEAERDALREQVEWLLETQSECLEVLYKMEGDYTGEAQRLRDLGSPLEADDVAPDVAAEMYEAARAALSGTDRGEG